MVGAWRLLTSGRDLRARDLGIDRNGWICINKLPFRKHTKISTADLDLECTGTTFIIRVKSIPAPELLVKTFLLSKPKLDFYSFGILAYELFVGKVKRMRGLF